MRGMMPAVPDRQGSGTGSITTARGRAVKFSALDNRGAVRKFGGLRREEGEDE
jgi:hypothetical protein